MTKSKKSDLFEEVPPLTVVSRYLAIRLFDSEDFASKSIKGPAAMANSNVRNREAQPYEGGLSPLPNSSSTSESLGWSK